MLWEARALLRSQSLLTNTMKSMQRTPFFSMSLKKMKNNVCMKCVKGTQTPGEAENTYIHVEVVLGKKLQSDVSIPTGFSVERMLINRTRCPD